MKKISILIFLVLALLVPLIYAYEIEPYPDELDYRNFQGQNWMTSVKNQGNCGSCWAFATVGIVESFLNLYYNQHLDLDLSEQQLVSNCCINCGSCWGGHSYQSLDYAQQNGIVDEYCFPYLVGNSDCNLCENWEEKVWKLEHEELNNLEIDVKSKLNSKGPMPMIIWDWQHAIGLVGYEKNGDEDVWVFKNSWGSDWGENGFGYISAPLLEERYLEFEDYLTNIIQAPVQKDMHCEDNDEDSYCYWGLTESKPVNCPSSCVGNNFSDVDDSDPEINKEFDLWISGYDIPNKIHINETAHYLVNVSFQGNEQIEKVNDVVLNLYVDGYLLMSQYIDSLSDRETFIVDFVLPPKTFYEPYFSNEFRYEIVPKPGEIWTENNYFETEVWVYTHETGFEIKEDNYVFDCASSNNLEGRPIEAIIGDGNYEYSGIYLDGLSNVTIKNCNISGWSRDIYVVDSEEINVLNNKLGKKSEVGIYFENSNQGLIQGNTIQESFYPGILLDYSDQNEISENIIKNTLYDSISVEGSNQNIIKNNTIENNYYGGISISYSNNNTIENNQLDKNEWNGILLGASNYNQIIGNVGNNNGAHGNPFIELWGSSFNVISNNHNQDSRSGFGLMLNSNNNTLTNNLACQEGNYVTYYSDLLCSNSISNAGFGNVLGYYYSQEDIRAVFPCQDGWPAHQLDFLACNQCEDGTVEGECSDNKPFYCQTTRNLISNCQECGCLPTKICQEDGTCRKVIPKKPISAIQQPMKSPFYGILDFFRNLF